MKRFVEVVAKSNFDTTVIIRNELEEYERLETVISCAFRRIKELDTKAEKFEIESVKGINMLEEPKS